MKKFTLLSVFALAAFCLMSFNIAPETNAADVDKFSNSGDINWNLWNECNGEIINVTGTWSTKVTRVYANGVWHYQSHVMYKNVKGVGQTSGAKYKANYTGNSKSKSSTCNYKSHSVYSWMLVAQGNTPNLIVKSRYTYEWTCDDFDYTDNYSVVCK